MEILVWCQIIGGIILSGGYFFQIKQLLITKSSKDINLTTQFIVLLGITLMQAYAIGLWYETGEFAFMLTNTIAWLQAIIMVALVSKYK